MWGINPFVVGRIMAGVGVTSALFGERGSVQQLSKKIKLFVSEQRAEAAKAMVRSVATQDKDLYERLRRELENELDPQQYKDIFGDYPDIKSR